VLEEPVPLKSVCHLGVAEGTIQQGSVVVKEVPVPQLGPSKFSKNGAVTVAQGVENETAEALFVPPEQFEVT